MPATIQQIVKPTRARGLDTSNSEQIVGNQLLGDPSFDIPVLNGEVSAGGWRCEGQGVSISGGKADWADDGTASQRRLKDNIDGPFSDLSARYRLTITISDYTDGGIRIVSGSYYGTYLTAAGTYVIDFSPETGSGNLQIDGNEDAHLSVSEVSLYKLESFGNNNHAQIYSGRALEFDGVSDHLTTSLSTADAYSTTNFTIAAWYMSYTTTLYETIIGTDAVWSSGVWLTLFNNQVRANVNQTGGDYALHHEVFKTGSIIEDNTWYRIVFTYDSVSGGKLYLNGVEVLNSDGLGEPLGEAYLTSNVAIGATNTGIVQYPANGKISDVQIWNATWTAADAEYDYLNPEQLALNRGGTSLTNSNLKLWYPMNEGHRGNQSYVLDASNTGLGDEIEMDGDFSEYTTISSPRGNSNISGIALTNWIEQGDNDGEYADTSGSGAYTISKIENGIRLETTEAGSASWHHRIYNTIGNSLTEGVTYRLKFDLKADAQRACSIRNTASTVILTDIPTNPSSTEFTTYTKYFTMTGDSNLGFFIFGNATSVGSFFEIRNVSIVPINDKHNATTEFYGDEQITDQVNRDFSGSGNWGNYGGSTTPPTISGGKLVCVTNGDGGNEGAQLTIGRADGTGSAHPIVAGRTYRMSALLDNTDGKANPDINFSLGNKHVSIVRASDGGTTGQINTTEQEYYADITAVDDSTAVLIYQASADNTAPGTTFTIDDVSIKEIGTAMGWTDADQQLDIPQTALQSYNQLAWFDGSADYVSIADHDDFSFGDGNTTDSAFSVSGWVFPNEATKCRIISKQDEWLLTLNGSDKPLFSIYDNSASNQEQKVAADALTAGKWYHIVGTYDGTGGTSANSGMELYVNGKSVGTNTDAGTYQAMHNKGHDVLIGSLGIDTSFAEGCITECSIWNKELSEAEVLELYNDGLALDATTHSGSSNLIGYWRNNGLATWQDLTDNDRDGTLTSITETMLITAGADRSRDSQGFLMNRQRTTNSLNIPFLGFHDNAGGNTMSSAKIIVEKPNIDYETSGFSVAFWMKAAISGEAQFIIGNQDSTNTGLGWHVRAGGGNVITFVVGDGTDYYDQSASGNVCDGEWHYIACVYNPQTSAKTYIDGSLNVTDSGTPSGGGGAIAAIEPVGDLDIGNRRGVNDQAYIGQLDDITIYEKQLELPEVTRNYNAGKRSHR